MTREEYQAWKTKTNRAGEIIGRIELLERAKDQQQLDWNISSGFECHATAKEIISKDDLQNLFTLGIETRISQLEQELADITVGEVAKPAPDACCSCLSPLKAGEQIFSTYTTPAQPFAEITCESPLIAGGVQP